MTKNVKYVGFGIEPAAPPLNPAIIEAFEAIPTTDIAGVVGRLYTLTPGLIPFLRESRRVAGTAFTVRVPAGDSLMVHAAVDRIGENDILVADTGGDMNYCLGGSLLCSIAQGRGAKAFVLDGTLRDVEEINDLQFPVYALSPNPRPAAKNGPGQINVPVHCRGVVVHPGDVIVADEEGIVVVPRPYVDEVLEAAQSGRDQDADRLADTAQWAVDHRRIFNERLHALGVIEHAEE